MRHRIRLLAASAAAFVASASAIAQPRQQLASEINVHRDNRLLQGDFSPPQYRFIGEHATDGWITPEDMPADLRGRLIDVTSFIGVEVNETGGVSCRILHPSSEPRLDALACALLPVRGRFPISRAGPGRPVAVTIGYRVRWETVTAETHAERRRGPFMAPPVPMASGPGALSQGPWDRVWPRMIWSSSLRPGAIPAIQSAWPARAGRPAQGIVGLDLLVDPLLGVTGCEVGASSGNPMLDALACEVARGVRLDYFEPCDTTCRPERLPLQIVWARRGSHIRFPLLSEYSSDRNDPLRDPADSRPVRRPSRVPVTLVRPSEVGRPADATTAMPRRTLPTRSAPTACSAPAGR
ncbi:MAG TPA: hypothetical protein VMS43_05740 [Allosphingosinicella sp.]|nr:hypothetical protein [Allosphingosinicella sp.]